MQFICCQNEILGIQVHEVAANVMVQFNSGLPCLESIVYNRSRWDVHVESGTVWAVGYGIVGVS